MVPNTPVIYYTPYRTQSNNAVRLEALDWSGAARGHLDIPGAMLGSPTGEPKIVQSPDGQRLIVMDDVYTAQGKHLYHLQLEGRRWATLWADDGRHLCTEVSKEDSSGLAWSVLVVAEGGGVEHTVRLPHTTAGQSGWNLESCSIAGDRLVTYFGVDMMTTGVLVSRISTGAPILHQSNLCGDDQCTQGPMWSTVTPDARWAAETLPANTVRLRDLVTGRVTPLRTTGVVLALSRDGSRLLVDRRQDGGPSTVSLVDVHSNTVLWSHQMASPGSSDVGVAPAGASLAISWHPASPGPSAQPIPQTLTLLSASTPFRPRDLVIFDVYSLWE